MPSIEYQNHIIKYEIIRRKSNQKNVILRFRNGQLIVSAPKYTQTIQIESIVKQNAKWIVERLQKINFQSSPYHTPAVPTLQTVFISGVSYPITIIHVTGSSVEQVGVEHIKDKEIQVLLPHTSNQTRDMKNRLLHHALYQYLLNSAQLKIPDLVLNLGETFDLIPKRVVVKEQRSRFGSCSTNGSIYMNWRLIQAPEIILQYVSIHELAHLREQNHSPAFWKLVESMMPTYRECKRWLKLNGDQLFMITI